MATATGVCGKFVWKNKLSSVQNLIQNNKDESWKSGRRVVELGYLEDNFKCSYGSTGACHYICNVSVRIGLKTHMLKLTTLFKHLLTGVIFGN